MGDQNLKEALECIVRDAGADVVACADLSPLPESSREGLPRGVCIGVALDRRIIARNADGPTGEYAAEYERANSLLNRIAGAGASVLRRSGFRALPADATSSRLDPSTLATSLPHKTVATRAGVGWIGKCALLITRDYGSAIRFNTILTDAPLPAGTPIEASRCGRCAACVDACPAAALTGAAWSPDVDRATLVDAFACRDTAAHRAATVGVEHAICGICIVVCPFTRRYCRRRRAPQPRDTGPSPSPLPIGH